MPRLSIVPPNEEPCSADIAAQWRADIKRRDWTQVHLEGDRNPPFLGAVRKWLKS